MEKMWLAIAVLSMPSIAYADDWNVSTTEDVITGAATEFASTVLEDGHRLRVLSVRCRGGTLDVILAVDDFVTSGEPAEVEWRFEGAEQHTEGRWAPSTEGTGVFAPQSQHDAIIGGLRDFDAFHIRVFDYQGTPTTMSFSLDGASAALDELSCVPSLVELETQRAAESSWVDDEDHGVPAISIQSGPDRLIVRCSPAGLEAVVEASEPLLNTVGGLAVSWRPPADRWRNTANAWEMWGSVRRARAPVAEASDLTQTLSDGYDATIRMGAIRVFASANFEEARAGLNCSDYERDALQVRGTSWASTAGDSSTLELELSGHTLELTCVRRHGVQAVLRSATGLSTTNFGAHVSWRPPAEMWRDTENFWATPDGGVTATAPVDEAQGIVESLLAGYDVTIRANGVHVYPSLDFSELWSSTACGSPEVD